MFTILHRLYSVKCISHSCVIRIRLNLVYNKSASSFFISISIIIMNRVRCIDNKHNYNGENYNIECVI